MPWRAAPGSLADPYAVLVSETMLQQTQVATVAPYFQRFMARFPTLLSLAAAQEQQVLTVWQGLGYYRRARSLHAAARAVVGDHGGRVPRTLDELTKLPGVGRYTAGAIASIAYGVAAPVVDGNVSRVLARLIGDRRAVDHRVATRRFWRIMEDLVRSDRPGDVNQAVMELGATVCLPRAPRCEGCPIRSQCKAFATGRPERFGAKGKRTRPIAVQHRVIAIHKSGRWLMERRGDTGLWARMWQFPTWESIHSDHPSPIEEVVKTQTGLSVGPLHPIGDFIHVTSHRQIRFQVYAAAAQGGRARAATRWRSLSDLIDLPMSKAQHRVAALLRER